MRILIAEDDASLASFVKKGLDAEHYAVDVSNDGEQARAMAGEFDYDLVVLDLNLPRLDGVSILRYLRTRKPTMPIMVLTGRTRVEDRVQCLDLGADDYLGKPFSFSELSARIRALLRRCHLPAESVLTVEDLKLDRVERRVERAGRRIDLTGKEFALLEYLMRNAGRRITRAMIIEHVWNLSFDTCTNVVDVYVNYLASCKLAPVGATVLLQLDLAVAFPLIDVLLGGQGGASAAPERQLTEIEEQILETVMRIICRELQSAWQVLALEFEFEARQQTEQVQRLMPSEEKTLSLNFDITVAESRGTLNLVFPAVVSNALLRKLSAGWVRAKLRARPDSEQRWRDRLRVCPFGVELGMTIPGVPLRDLMNLSPGSLLVLKTPAQPAAVLRVSGCELFMATVARRGRLRAAQVLEPCHPEPDRKTAP
jgi:two-component system copper resistance phosphate regulon response regulator CusR